MTYTNGSIGFDCGETKDTRNNIRALRNSGQLEPGCIYTATDINWVLAGGVAEFSAVAIGEETLAMHGYYESPLLNPGEPWEGYLDWDNGRVYYLHDGHIRENEVHGDGEVRSFPWDSPTVRRMLVRHSTFTYTGGTVDNVTLTSGAELRMTGGAIRESDIIGSGRVRILGNSQVRDAKISSEGRLYITGDGTIVNQVEVTSESTVNILAATMLEESTFDESSFVYLDGGSHYRFNLSTDTYVDARGWSGRFRQVDLNRIDLRISGTGRFENSIIDGLGYIRMRNVVNTRIENLSAQGYIYLTADRAEDFEVFYSSYVGMGYIYANDSTNVRIERGEMDTNGILNLTSATDVTVTRGKFRQNAQFYGIRSTGRIDYMTFGESSYIRADDATGYDFDQNKIEVGCYMDMRRSQNLLIREMLFSANTNTYANDSVGCRFRYGKIFRSNVYVRNATNIFYESPQLSGGFYQLDGSQNITINYLGSSTYGYLRGLNAPSGNITRVTLNGYGLIRLQGNIAAGWALSDTTISSQSDVRIESGGAVRRSSLESRGILVARHTGTIDRAHIMQVFTTQTAPSSNLTIKATGIY